MKRTLLLILTLALAATPASATLDGSTAALLAPGAVNPGDTAIFIFEIENGSIDGESISEVKLVMPGDSDILSGWYDDLGHGWNLDFSIEGEWSELGFFRDADGDPGEIAPGTSGYFYLEVYIHTNMDCGINTADVRLFGDNVGGIPHWINIDDLPFQVCGVPTQMNTWTNVKGLYR